MHYTESRCHTFLETVATIWSFSGTDDGNLLMYPVHPGQGITTWRTSPYSEQVETLPISEDRIVNHSVTMLQSPFLR
jgi:hypothetical protein